MHVCAVFGNLTGERVGLILRFLGKARKKGNGSSQAILFSLCTNTNRTENAIRWTLSGALWVPSATTQMEGSGCSVQFDLSASGRDKEFLPLTKLPKKTPNLNTYTPNMGVQKERTTRKTNTCLQSIFPT